MRLIPTLLIGGAALLVSGMIMRRTNRNDALHMLRRYSRMAGKAVMGRKMIRRLWVA